MVCVCLFPQLWQWVTVTVCRVVQGKMSLQCTDLVQHWTSQIRRHSQVTVKAATTHASAMWAGVLSAAAPVYNISVNVNQMVSRVVVGWVGIIAFSTQLRLYSHFIAMVLRRTPTACSANPDQHRQAGFQRHCTINVERSTEQRSPKWQLGHLQIKT